MLGDEVDAYAALENSRRCAGSLPVILSLGKACPNVTIHNQYIRNAKVGIIRTDCVQGRAGALA
jgi:hypothetical protein